MMDLFAAVPEDLRRHRLQEYGQYLIDRDGEMNVQEMTLSAREQRTRRYEEAPAASQAVDVREFDKQYSAFSRRRPPAEEMTLLLSLVKVNAAEAYGVSRNLQRTMDRALKNGDQSELRIMCEEGYHTRILLSSAKLYGIEVHQPYTPPSALRVLIGGIATMPMSVARPLTLAAEIIATLLFAKLLTTTQRVLAHRPEIRDAIEERLLEICTDERGHITYNRLHMGPAALAQTRLLLPMMARTMATPFPEVVALGAYPHDVFGELPTLTDPRRLPECVRRDAFVA